MAGVSYAYLLLTGLAFWSPWLFWIAAALGGATVARELHPWAGLIFVVAVSLMYRMWGVEMKQTAADKAWWEAIPHYIRNEDESMPSTGRFNPGQKIVFWAFFWCGILLLLSGIILWFTDYIPWSLRFLRYFAVIVHPVTALLTIGLFIIHVYMGTAALPGAFGAMMRGDVSNAWAKTHHRVWFEEILRSASPRK
jgi:formate dehydrogenase subunit gamma